MNDSRQLQIDETNGLLRITIPFGSREKIWMGVALTVMLIFGALMSLVGEFAARSATNIRIIWFIPLFVLGIIAAFYLLSLLALRSLPGSVIEFDGKDLSIGSIGSAKRQNWPKAKIKSLEVSRLPMVPVANLVIYIDGVPSVRTAVCRQRDLEFAASKLRDALGLKSRARK
jgi:hypothetical protein